MSDPVEDEIEITESNDDLIPQGAACREILSGPNPSTSLTTVRGTLVSDIEGISAPRSSPRYSPTFQVMPPGLDPQQRRYSTFLSPNDTYHQHQYYRTHRHASLPSLPNDLVHNLNNNIDFKKMMLEDSRRSSFESAYHSQRSDPMSSSRMEFNDSNSFADDAYYLPNHPFNSQENLERDINERRNSLSYEAIRTYFLERNPYIHQIQQSAFCLDHRQLGSSTCPQCRRRTSTLALSHLFSRTRAHQAVIERQFEDLSNIPDQRQSRSTSIDIFGGITLPFHNQDGREELNQITDDENILKNDSDEIENLQKENEEHETE